MAHLDTTGKLAILADAAKYDASCASSAAPRRTSLGGTGVGSTGGSGICHAYAPDGRCISLLKILLTNVCVFDCAYCINRASSNVRRARFTAEEVVGLTLDFYKRNYIEGLFLSSGIIRSSNYTMEQVVRVARMLRQDHDFRGYIHLKTIPDADPALIEEAGRYADRLSINVELPRAESFPRLAPEKQPDRIEATMGGLARRIGEAKAARRESRRAPLFAPAGQSTQLIVGADGASDAEIMSASRRLYESFRLKRVYYSAYSPIPASSSLLPAAPPPLLREHRLYQADWLTRFYGYSLAEIVGSMRQGMLDLAADPKLVWALANRQCFPVDINRADREMLLRVPGLGVRSVGRILSSRRHRTLRFEDLSRLTRSAERARPFVVTADSHPGQSLDGPMIDQPRNASRVPEPARRASHHTGGSQLELFAA
ncbi:MAG: putative DNA modification/repair radical SAM protein [Hyphomicrobiaceae bacterium]|nr:putative DNA modification/repair radical SAM protein [Hyphomicrobiaceae bacterium]